MFFVSDLKCNLISASQLVEESNCIVQFTNKFCVIQDHNTRKLIGASELCKGLYYFQGKISAKVMQATRKDTIELWHQRLEHPSNKVIKLLPVVGRNSNKFIESCEVCFRAKQSRGEFMTSDNKASHVFEMIHYDLWGPYRTPLCGAHFFYYC